MVVSPDVGSTARVRAFSMKLGVNMAIVDKRREKANQSEVMNIIGNVEGKTCILLDDIVDTAGSLCGAAKAISEIGGAKKVYACATHGVLSGPAIERIENSCIKELLLLDTIPYPTDKPRADKIKYISTAPVFAEAIRRIYEEVSISNLFEINRSVSARAAKTLYAFKSNPLRSIWRFIVPSRSAGLPGADGTRRRIALVCKPIARAAIMLSIKVLQHLQHWGENKCFSKSPAG